MATLCPTCSRMNPAEAHFCYFDGMPLLRDKSAGPIQPGSVPFPQPFVFPNGQACRNFNQLVLACQNHWEEARNLLKQGIWQNFFGGLGRGDLVQAAQQAAGAADGDRGLAELLGKLPAETLQPPKLAVEPTQLNLGQLTPGSDGTCELVVRNQGMLLLAGTAAATCDWLGFGEGAGQPQRVFQTTGTQPIPIRILGPKLRAAQKPLEAEIHLDTNGGSMTVLVRAEVPVRPFPSGVLAGAVTPREVAEKAKAHPKEAAMLFEQGAVQSWYQSNGWTYPVEGPVAAGMGAVQQFFEALGVAKPPQITIDRDSVPLQGKVGERLAAQVVLSTVEKKNVFAHGKSNQPWLTVEAAQCRGTTATVPISLVVPPRAGETLAGEVVIRANGNQRFVVRVRLAIAAGPLPAAAKPAMPPPIGAARPAPAAEAPWWTQAGAQPEPVLPPAPPPPPVKPTPVFTSPAPPPAPAAGPVLMAEAAPELAETEGSVFGMSRLVYWSAMVGGWSAFLGWGVAELLVGRWVGSHLLFAVVMVALVGCALGGGLSQVGGLTTSQWRNQLGQLGPGLLGGLVGGLVGGVLGNLLYFLMGQQMAILSFFGRVLGWSLLGVAIGISEGLLERHWRKVRNGLIGGGLGGFIGGLLFNPVSYLVGSPLSSRAFAFVAVGLCIGLFVSLVEVLLKEAWLTVEAGFRPGRQLILKQETTTLGTSEKGSLIFIAVGAKGVEPTHFFIRRQDDGSFWLEDNHSRTGTLLNGVPVKEPAELQDGDLIAFGPNKVRFNERYQAKANT